MTTKRAARGLQFLRMAEKRRMLTPTEIAWRERLQDFEFEFRPMRVTNVVSPQYINAYGMTDDAPMERVEKIGPQHKTVQFIRTVRLSLD